MQENSKEFVEYKSFDELPEELKEKFKNGANGSGLAHGRKGYIDFINQLKRQNDELIGDYVDAITKTQVRFKKCGHKADISPNNYKRGRGCGVCKGKQVQQGINDLATTHQSLIKEWHPIKNGNLTSHDVRHCSSKKVWWQCEYGHEWKAAIYSRTKGSKCPYCSNKKNTKRIQRHSNHPSTIH